MQSSAYAPLPGFLAALSDTLATRPPGFPAALRALAQQVAASASLEPIEQPQKFYQGLT